MKSTLLQMLVGALIGAVLGWPLGYYILGPMFYGKRRK